MFFRADKKFVNFTFMLDYSKLLEMKKILDEKGIAYTLKTKSNSLRLSLNNLDGHSIALNRDKSIQDYYIITVKKEDEVAIRKVLSYFLGN